MQPVPGSAVVMLSHAMDSNGQLDQQSAARAQLAAQVYKQQQAQYLVTNGWAYRDDVDYSIATAVKQHLIDRYELTPQNIIAEPNSRDTVGDAYFSKTSVIAPRGINAVWVITSDYHLNRAQEIFSFIYGNDISLNFRTVQGPDTGDMETSESKSISAFRNTFQGIPSSDDTQILKRLQSAHPFYNGEIHPKIEVLPTE